MANKHSKKSHAGAGRRFFGIVFLLIGAVILVANEIRTFKMQLTLNAAASWVEMEDPDVLDPSLEGKLVHATDSVTTPDILSDPDFSLSCNAIILQRRVQYYQLVETSEHYYEDGESYYEYSYSRSWQDKPVNSKEFHESGYRKKNFTLMTFDSWKAYASKVSLGAYKLPAELYQQMERDTGDKCLVFIPVASLKPDVLQRLNEETCRAIGAQGDFVCLDGGRIFLGADPQNPQIGDVRIWYEGFLPEVCSVMAQVRDGSLVIFQPEGGKPFGEMSRGVHPAEDFLTYRTKDNIAIAWGLRVIALLHLLVGGLLYKKGREMRE